jgi:hypothetical protein
MISVDFGKLLGKPVYLYHVGRFACHGVLGRGVLVQHQESRKADYHPKRNLKCPVDHADSDVVRLAKL